MSKMKVQDATKELSKRAAKLLGDVTSVRTAAEKTLAELRKLEAAGDYTARLALLEEQKSLPWQAVWEMYCQRHDTPAGSEWLESVRAYEKEILSRRG